MKIGQLCLLRLTSPPNTPRSAQAGSKYQGQRGPTPSRTALPAGVSAAAVSEAGDVSDEDLVQTEGVPNWTT